MINIVSYSTAKGGSGKGGSGGGGSVTNYNTYTGIQPLYLWGNYFDGTSDIEGNLTSNGTIRANDIITKNSIRANIIDVLSATTEYFKTISIDASGDANIGGGTHIHQNLQVDGSTNIGGGASIGGNTTISGSTSMTGDLYSGGGARIGGNTTISGSTSMTGDLYSGGSARIDDNATIGGNVNISGSTFTEGSSTVHHDMTVGGDGKIYGDAVISGTTTTTDIYSENITNTGTIRTKDLEVTGTAHFFELIIDKIKAAGGAILLTPADGFRVDYVEDVTNGKKLYFRSTDNSGKGIMNMWKAGDQAICQSFNEAKVGVSYNVSNKYWWSVVTFATEQPVQKVVDGEVDDYHYIIISTEEGYDEKGRPYYDGTINCEVGDEVAMLGYRGTDEPQRQSAIYMAAYRSVDLGLTAPHFAEYQGIDDFNLAAHRRSYIDANGAKFVGYLYVDANTSVQDYITNETTEIRNEFKFDLDGLTSKVEHKSRPNIVSNNDWHDQDNAPLYQENDELYEVSGTTECTAYPPVMYLNAGTYTPSIYGYGKFKTIRYGESKNNLENYLPVETMINFNDTWNDLPRSQAIFIAPIDGYYGIGVELMDESYSGDTEYYDYIGDGGGSGSGSTSGQTVQTTISLTAADDIKVNRTKFTSVDVYPPMYNKVVYRSSNPSVVSVDEYGRIHGTGEGHALIYAFIPEAYSGGYHYLPSEDYKNVQCVVSAQTTTTLTAPSSMYSGMTANVSSTVTPSDYPGTVVYETSDPSILDINGTSLVVNGFGDVTITARANEANVNGYKWLSSSDSKHVTVSDYNKIPSSVEINLSSNMIRQDYTLQPEVITTPPEMDWYLKSTSNYVISTSGHTYTGANGGQAALRVITVPLVSGDTMFLSSSATTEDITCIPTGATSCSISVESPIKTGNTKQASFTITPSQYIYEYQLSSSDENIARVDNNGNVYGINVGTCTINMIIPEQYYHNTIWLASSASTTVNVEQTTGQTSVSLSVEDHSLVRTRTTNATVTRTPETAPYTLSSSDESVVTVDESGVVTAVGLGSAYIIAEVPEYVSGYTLYYPSSATTAVSVDYDIATPQVSITADKHIMAVGETTQTTTTVSPSGLTVNVSGNGFSVDSNGLATAVDATENGNVRATVPEQTVGNVIYQMTYDTKSIVIGQAVLRYTATRKLSPNYSSLGVWLVWANEFENGNGTVAFSNYPTKIKADWMKGEKKITSISIPERVATIGDRAFSGCTAMEAVELPNTVTSIGSLAFAYCTSLSEINIPSGVTAISESVFSKCSSLNNVVIPSGVTSIGSNAFAYCTSLSEINIPSGVTAISTLVFSNCSSLNNVVIPSGVTDIGNYAFFACNAMTDMTILATTPPTADSSTFWLASGKHNTLHVPAGSVSAYQALTEYTRYFTNIVAI